MKEIALTQGYITIVDDEDYEMLVSFGSWYAKKTAKDGLVYAVCSVKNRQIQMGRVITSCPKGKVVDHINGNGADILIDSIKILNFGKTLSTYEKSSSFVTNAHLYMERICTNTSL